MAFLICCQISWYPFCSDTWHSNMSVKNVQRSLAYIECFCNFFQFQLSISATAKRFSLIKLFLFRQRREPFNYCTGHRSAVIMFLFHRGPCGQLPIWMCSMIGIVALRLLIALLTCSCILQFQDNDADKVDVVDVRSRSSIYHCRMIAYMYAWIEQFRF